MATIRVLPFTASLFIVFLVVGFFCVVCSAKDDRHHCAPSSCGIIPYISYPFRLKHDPDNCGDQRYNLSCEQNRTVFDQDPYDIREWTKKRSGMFNYIEISKPIIFLTCETQVNSPVYVDTAPCTSPMSSSSGHGFVKIGHLNASDMRDLCRIDLTVATSWPGAKDMNVSYIDIHKELIYYFKPNFLYL
ncbi:unnamed protein product [Malus baccata var. baccata]